ncbi:MAG: alcohol dehydrogenase catalytic domain-containing protein [Acetobacteraceae bacterium]|nr:alcohol dehydrogenase catalytic domain-containing protein [Acetobacteraceae bacterium]
MLALRKPHPAPGLLLCEVPEPTPAPGEVLLRVHAVGICGTDLHIADWTAGYGHMAAYMPVTLGHEAAGEIVVLGEGVQGCAVGARVTFRPSTACGRCAACGSGRPEDCADRRGIGIHRDGAFAAFVSVPAANCLLLPAGVDTELGALAEPLSVGLHAADLAAARPGARVLVLGPGPIGLAAALFAAQAGAEVVVAGRGDAARLALAREAFGLKAVDSLECAPTSVFAGYPPFDAVIEAAGAAAAVADGLALLRPGGVLVVAGIHSAPVGLDLTRLVRAELRVQGTYRAPAGDWQRVLAALARDGERLRRLITHRLPLAAAERGFALARAGQACKVLLLP